MSGLIELFPGSSEVVRDQQRVEVKNVIDAALDAKLTTVALVGRQIDGELYIASSHDSDRAIALLTRAIAWLAEGKDIGIVDESEKGA